MFAFIQYCFRDKTVSKTLSPRLVRLLKQNTPEEAQKIGSTQLMPEHLLLALLKTASGLGYITLQYINVNVLSFQLALEQSLSEHLTEADATQEIPLSCRLKALLDTAVIESRTLQHDYVGTEHTVLAAVREEQSVTWHYFRRAGLSVDEVRQTVYNIAQKYRSSANAERDKESVFTENEQPSFAQGQKQRKHSVLDSFSCDLTVMARNGTVDPVIGRERELKRMIQILCRRTKNNPILIGDPGVGKTAIAEALALRIIAGTVPNQLAGKRLLSLDLAQLVAGTKYRGEFEERIKRILKEISEAKNIILFIDEVHTMIGAGSAEGSIDASNILKPMLSRGELQCIGATTLVEYRKHFERDAALERRFQIVQVFEPSDDETRQILIGLKQKYEKFHGVKYTPEAVDATIRLSQRYLAERFLPDKAIDILDEAGSMKNLEYTSRPPELDALKIELEKLDKEKQLFVQNQNYEQAANMRSRIFVLQEKFEMLRKKWSINKTFDEKRKSVTMRDICRVVEAITGIPASQIESSESKQLLNMEREIHRTFIGQVAAVSTIVASIRRARTGISSAKRPFGSFVFLGPTGVGKTQLAKTLANFLFGSENALIRIDMSDFMEKHNASRLVGAPPGYIGYEEGGLLTEKVRRCPYCIVLLDEIEKAHSDVFNLLLQILEEGELQDNLGHRVSFRNALIIMTSNAGVREITPENRLGFNTRINNTLSHTEIKNSAINELKRFMSPELVNRIDDIIVFTALSLDEVSAILDLQLKDMASRLVERGLTFSITVRAKRYFIERGYNPMFGARSMRRVLQNEVENPLSEALLLDKNEGFDIIRVDYRNNEIKIKFKKTQKKNQ
ncbi:ATP-dependent Clp protease ATP-binding subunit [Treponema endosymbiont of Eucomonympha sp.]|uniref:ATP-dependent Clp protease ATP-binding subunit n=1 Tax=Treponema endosymbiont of Eucomonympha sp. TaxID=1580831 RepID=UPI001E2AA4C7|nr:ATP-dependent Clp protease ATP-binding subunit [Treponema endosymbiont of Eucomonympha sp.]